jgi:type II secretory pathway pseudopilin PulG
MHRRRHAWPRASGGWTLTELVVAIGVSLVVAGLALAAFAPLTTAARATGAARHLAASLQQARLDAVRTRRACGFRFRSENGGIVFEAVADGNGNGLRGAELDDGTDVVRGPSVRLADAFAGARFAILTDVPAIDGGPGLAAGSDPIRIGSSILAFAPTGTATSGTLYIAGGDERQLAVRILGPTGRVRVFAFDRAAGRWVPR